MDSKTKSLKDQAIAIATEISSADVIDADLWLSRLAKFKGTYEVKAGNGHSHNNNTEKLVGIWKSKERGGKEIFERDPAFLTDWLFWSNMHQIPEKTDKFRVVFLGESVARGYMYDPHYTPASVLEKVLNTSQHERKFEVIDLARTNLGLSGLLEIATQCLLLQPDAIVIFAGNNWKFGFSRFGDEELSLIRDYIFQPERFSKIMDILNRSIESDALKVLDRLSEISKTNNIPIQFVIPEFNLVDWRSTKLERIPGQFDGSSTRDWLAAREAALEALKKTDWPKVEAEAQEMIRLDPGNPLGYELMADSKIDCQLFDEAREYLEAAKDYATLFQRADSKPRILRKTRETLLKHARTRGISVIDLKEVFRNYLDGRLPDKRLFIDYCHLTVEGIQLAMKESAAGLLSKLDVPADPRGVSLRAITPDNEVISLAFFYAALHNIHWGQPAKLANYYVENALRYSSRAIQFILLYIDMASRRCPTQLCDSFIKLPELYMDLTKPKGNEIIDLEIVDGMLDQLEKHSIKLKQRIAILRYQEFGYQDAPISLLDSYYSTNSFQTHIGFVSRMYYRSHETVSEFRFPSRNTQGITIDIVYRLPDYNTYKEEEFSIYLNENLIYRLPVSSKWNQVSVYVPKEMLVNGISSLKVMWPVYTSRKKSFSHTDRSVFDILYEKFGEIFSLRVAAGPQGEDKITESSIVESVDTFA